MVSELVEILPLHSFVCQLHRPELVKLQQLQLKFLSYSFSLQLQLPVAVASCSCSCQFPVAVAVASCQLPVAQTLRLEDKLDGATNFRGMHLYMFPSYII
jgi:hypothetical protein